jgi:hypothetical protein
LFNIIDKNDGEGVTKKDDADDVSVGEQETPEVDILGVHLPTASEMATTSLQIF